jgi:hypothetical protein
MTQEHVERIATWRHDVDATRAEKVKGKADRNGVLPDDAESGAPNLFVFTLSSTDADAINAEMPAESQKVLKKTVFCIDQAGELNDLMRDICRIDFTYNDVIVESFCGPFCPPELFRFRRQEFSYTGGESGQLYEVNLNYYFEKYEDIYFPVDLKEPGKMKFVVYCHKDFTIGTRQFEVRGTFCTRYRLQF